MTDIHIDKKGNTQIFKNISLKGMEFPEYKLFSEESRHLKGRGGGVINPPPLLESVGIILLPTIFFGHMFFNVFPISRGFYELIFQLT